MLRNPTRISAISSLFLVFVIHGALSQSCLSLRKPGTCKSIMECPALLNLAKMPFTTANIRKLQKLTCGFDGDNPKVCCLSRGAPVTKIDEKLLRTKLNFLPRLSECGTVDVDTSNRIIGGKIPTIGSNPWLARIGYLIPGRHPDTFEYYCGGTIINKRYILTAAHCVVSVESDENVPSIRLGEHDEREDPEYSPELQQFSYVRDFEVEKVISHPDYNSATRMNDIALIRVSKDIPFNSSFIKPVCLPMVDAYQLKSFPNLGTHGYNSTVLADVAGWGRTLNENRGTPIINYVKVPIVSNVDCENIYVGRTGISSRQICAGGEADKDSCDGDSGGPLITFEESVGKHFQVGVVSFGPTVCGTGGLPGIYTRVSEYFNWILNSIE